MKTTVSAFALSAALAAPSLAGGLAEPVITMEPMEIAEAAAPSSSSADLIIPLILVAFITAAMAGDDAPVSVFSDERVKTDIVPVGMTASGLPLYHYRYIGSAQVFEGVMAQDVVMHTPSAVVTYPSGMMAVDYSTIGVTPKTID